MFEMAEVSRAPQSLTSHEREALISAARSGRHGLRNATILQLAVGTGLREHEIVALDLGDVLGAGGVRQRIRLRVFKGHRRQRPGRGAQEVLVPAGVRAAVKDWTDHRCSTGSAAKDAPLFVSQQGTRLCTRSLRLMFASVQDRAGLERRFTFHHLRHTFCTDLYLHSTDLRVVQRAARHARIGTTVVYTHPPDERLLGAVEGLDAARNGRRPEGTHAAPFVSAGEGDHFLAAPPLTFPELAHSESAVGTPQGNFAAAENSTTPRPAPRPPAHARVARTARRPSARANRHSK